MVRDSDLACWNRKCTLPDSHPGVCCPLPHPHPNDGATPYESEAIGSVWDTLTEGKLVTGNYPLWPAVGTTLDGGVQLVITGLAPWLAACERGKAHQG